MNSVLLPARRLLQSWRYSGLVKRCLAPFTKQKFVPRSNCVSEVIIQAPAPILLPTISAPCLPTYGIAHTRA